MYAQFRDVAEFYIVYIREAHPTDGWRTKSNDQAGILITQPQSFVERTDVALEMCVKLQLNLPCLLDGMDNKANENYSGWPDRIYVVGTDGRIVYKGAPGPKGFKPEEAKAALLAHLPAVAQLPN